jgi:sulfoxide reductase catalytic subunit YedY
MPMPASERPIPSSEITPLATYLNRRSLIRAGVAAGSVAATAWVYRRLKGPPPAEARTAELTGLARAGAGEEGRASGFRTDERPTPMIDVVNYNNFYEFSTGKTDVAAAAAGFAPGAWTVRVEGLVHEPRTFDLDDLRRLAPLEERVYRMRCVEGWSMVVPWAGFPLGRLLDRVRPMGSARHVAFETLFDPARMPNQRSAVLDWPYVEGLRLDEAQHPLTLLALGLYGRELPPQNGSPLRLVVPWKYGFKGIKSIVRIRLVEAMPPTTWSLRAPEEYGYFANVNPEVDHPRWSQATEMRLGESGRRPTLPFNGYAEQVAHLYSGMDLRRDF